MKTALKIYTILIFNIFYVGISAQNDPVTNKSGFSIFSGIGIGGNEKKNGFCRGFSMAYHWRVHAFDIYYSHTTKREAIRTKDRELTLNSSNYGFSYGLGIYDENFSVAALAGVGYSNINMILRVDPGSNPTGLFASSADSKFGATIGLNGSMHFGILGLSAKGYYNIFDRLSTYSLLLGVNITFH